MHVVRCPKCLNLLKLARPVAKARMRCKTCGAVFLATTEQVADSTPVAHAPKPAESPAQPPQTTTHRAAGHDEGARRGHAARYAPRKKPQATMVALIVLGLLAIVVILIVILASTSSTDEASSEQQVAAGDKRQQDAGKADVQPAERRPAPPRPGPGPGPAARQPKAGPTNVPRVVADCQINSFGLTGTARTVVTGGVTNNRSRGLLSATVQVHLSGAGGQTQTVRQTCRYIPSSSRMPFSIPWQVDADQVTRARGYVVAVTELPDSRVCWMINDSAQVSGAMGEKIALTDNVQSPTGARLNDVEIHCDFFRRRDEHAGYARGKLEEGTILPKDGAEFTVTFTPRSFGSPIIRAVIRGLGTKP